MRIIPHIPVKEGDDQLLTERLFDLALNGDTASDELNAIDAQVYARLEEAYGHDTEDHLPHARVRQPEDDRLSRAWGSATAAQIPPLPWAP